MVSQTDFVLDGNPQGDTAEQMAEVNYDSGLYRPYIDRQGRRCVDVNVGKQYDPKLGRDRVTWEKMTVNHARFRGYNSPVMNATLALRKDEWLALDTVVVKATRERLRAWMDLAAANTYTLDGMSKEILEHETMNDPGEARVDMDGMSESRVDAPLFQLEGLPLPITHMPFWFSARKLAISRNTGSPLSTIMAEVAARRVAEPIEKTTIGVTTGITYGTTASYGRAPAVYGYTNHPARNTGTVTTPTGSNRATTVSEVLALRTTL
jgi:hypothetical protein